MKKTDHNNHPYHYSVDKNLVQHLIDWGVPIGLFYIYFQFYNFGQISPSEMVKTTGLIAIALLALTLAIGPICRFFPVLDILKAHRKFWGISSVLFLLAHFFLVFIFFMKLDVTRLFNLSSPKFPGLTAGLIGMAILLVVTLTSNRKALMHLDPKIWKFIQTSSYLALIFGLAHFYLMEQVNGVLVIKRLLGQITFWFAGFAVVIRLIVLFFPSKK